MDHYPKKRGPPDTIEIQLADDGEVDDMRCWCEHFTAGFLRMVHRVGEAAKLGFPVHPHMLRHATGYKLANDGVDTRTLQAYLGHRSITNTVRYTELAPTRFRDLWR